MTRDEMENYIIDEYTRSWSDEDILGDMIAGGWIGVQRYTDVQIRNAFMELDPEHFDDDDAKKIKLEQKRLAVYNDN